MSKDKNKSAQRRDKFLWSAYRAMVPTYMGGYSRPGILFHREGGMAVNNPDIQRLVRDGHLVIRRLSRLSHRLSPKKFIGNFIHDYRHNDAVGPHLHGQVNVTWGIITEKGFRHLGVKLGSAFSVNQRVDYEYNEDIIIPAMVIESNPTHPMVIIESLRDGKRYRVAAENLKENYA